MNKEQVVCQVQLKDTLRRAKELGLNLPRHAKEAQELLDKVKRLELQSS